MTILPALSGLSEGRCDIVLILLAFTRGNRRRRVVQVTCLCKYGRLNVTIITGVGRRRFPEGHQTQHKKMWSATHLERLACGR